jgi:hypothetical protein
MKSPVVLLGVGEMGGVFSRGFLKLGHPVYPLTRDMDLDAEAVAMPDPVAVVVSVGESDIHRVLEAMPSVWRDKLVLVQNELLPRDWKDYEDSNVTVISIWFEKKPGQDFKVIIPSPVYGPRAQLIHDALGALNIPVNVLGSSTELLRELVCKNLYILTTNIAGLQVGGDVGQLWAEHEALARQVADEVLDIQDWLTGQQLDRETLIQGMLAAFEGDRAHKCMGRSAPARLARAIEIADKAGLATPKLRELQQQYR